jgi:hypothetical protein
MLIVGYAVDRPLEDYVGSQQWQMRRQTRGQTQSGTYRGDGISSETCWGEAGFAASSLVILPSTHGSRNASQGNAGTRRTHQGVVSPSQGGRSSGSAHLSSARPGAARRHAHATRWKHWS